MRFPTLMILSLLTVSSFTASYAMENKSQDDGLIFSPKAVLHAAQNPKQLSCDNWNQAMEDMTAWMKGLSLSRKTNYKAAQTFYLDHLKDHLGDLKTALQNSKKDFILSTLDQLSTLEKSLRTTLDEDALDPGDLTNEDLVEIKRVASHDQKVHVNRDIPPEEDRCFEAIVVKRTRFGNSDTMVDMETAELDVPAIIAFNALPKFKTEEEKTSGFGFEAAQSPSISYNAGKTSKYTINIDEFKKVYQMTSDTFYRGSDFRLKYNQGDGYLFLQDLTILGKGVSLTSVTQGTNTKDNAKLLKSIMEEDATKLPKKVDVVFGFSGTEKTPLAVQMRLTEKKNRIFTKDKGVAEWIINFVRSKNKDIVVSLMNGTLLKNMNASDASK